MSLAKRLNQKVKTLELCALKFLNCKDFLYRN